jgi:hypothetical protein
MRARSSPSIAALSCLFYISYLALCANKACAQTDLTGTWIGNDNGIYYFRQMGNDVWWAGFSTESPSGTSDLHRGLLFTSVFHGTLTGNTLAGNFADVPKGKMLTSGPLTLTVNGNELESEAAPSGYRAESWERIQLSTSQVDVFTLFNRVKKNQNAWEDHSLLDNLYPVKSTPVSILGHITNTPVPGRLVGLQYLPPTIDPYPVRVGYPLTECKSTAGRTYHDFICLDNNDNPPDGDLDFDMHVDRGDLDRQLGFWTNGWEPFPALPPPPPFPAPTSSATAGAFQNKLNLTNTLHVETIMYGGTTECGDTGATYFLAPGWQQPGALSTLFNGVPIAGQMAIQGPPDPSDGQSNQVTSILGVPFGLDAFVRITGILVFDCGHGLGHPCNANDPNYQNQEIHPVYSIDLIQDFSKWRPFANLTGVWAADDAGTYYVRQDGNTVWWLGLSVDEGLSFANIFQGTLQNDQISGNWMDIPLGQTANSGVMTVNANNDALSATMTRVTATGGFAGGSWQKLRDVDTRVFTVVVDQAEFSEAFWPEATEDVEIQVGSTRVNVKPQKPHSVKLADGREVMQAAIPARIRVDAPELSGLPMSAQFVGYRANWKLSEADFKSRTYSQSMTPPRVIREDTSRNKKEKEAELASKKVPAELKEPTMPFDRSPTGGLPALTIHYHIESADPPVQNRLSNAKRSK